MENIQVEIRKGVYFDSIVLLQLQQFLVSQENVIDAGVSMGTPTNKEILAQTGLITEQAKNAGSDDLIITVKGKDEQTAKNVLQQVDQFLQRSRSQSGDEYFPKSIETAVSMVPQARWVAVSVAGRYATGVAKKALEQDKHVFLYSDNVSVEDEINLKKEAAQKGLLVMGPDCGTAIINGIGLGFANRMKKGSIGVIGASGTGLQVVTSRIHQMGKGITHAIGTGGRDLSAEIGAITAKQGLQLLENDPETKVILIISKPPSDKVARELIQVACRAKKPVVISFLGYAFSRSSVGNIYFCSTLEQAVQKTVEISDAPIKDVSEKRSDFQENQKYIRGLFSGGTLAYEALILLKDFLPQIYSNISFPGVEKLENISKSQGHTILDLGSDEMTVGKLHPMIDQDTRIKRLLQEGEDPEVAIILLDVVLGDGAHPNPVSELAPAIEQIMKKAKEGDGILKLLLRLLVQMRIFKILQTRKNF